MAQKKSEGKMVREAFDGPKVDHDELISNMNARAAEQHERSSDASESAAKVAAYIEKTGLNSQAYSWGSSILKKLPKKDGQAKAMDVIRSLKVLLPMLENHVAGQGSAEMDLGTPETPDEPQASEPFEVDVDQEIVDGDPDLADEAADFESAASKANVTPLNFGGSRA